MKKLALIICLLFASAGVSLADGSCVVSAGYWSDLTAEIVWTCTGDSSNGSIPNTSAGYFSSLFKKYPYTLSLVVESLAADANVTNDSDVYLYDKLSGGADILEGDGVDQLDDSTRNFIRLTPNPVNGQVWLGVANQSGASGVYKVILTVTK
jgi:hypothetical protein